MYSSWNMKQDRQNFLFILGHFVPFYPTSNLQNQYFEKMKKKYLEISFYTCVPKMEIIWCMVLKIRSTRQNFFSFWTICCCYSPVTTKKNQNFEKLEKTHGDTIILQKGTINDNHTMHCSWDVMHSRQDFSLFWAIFCPFNPMTAQKIKILKK